MACDFSALSSIDPGDPEQATRLLDECTQALTSPQLWFWTLVFTIVGAVVGAWIGRRKNAVVRDALLGAALGPIGWIVSLLLPAVKPAPKCPACQRDVGAGDRHCRHCGARLG